MISSAQPKLRKNSLQNQNNPGVETRPDWAWNRCSNSGKSLKSETIKTLIYKRKFLIKQKAAADSHGYSDFRERYSFLGPAYCC